MSDGCSTYYAGAEDWLRLHYPRLHAVWLQSQVIHDLYRAGETDSCCAICRVKPDCSMHYGVRMCEADKQFLKRTFHYGLVYPACSAATVCPPRPRGWCQVSSQFSPSC